MDQTGPGWQQAGANEAVGPGSYRETYQAPPLGPPEAPIPGPWHIYPPGALGIPSRLHLPSLKGWIDFTVRSLPLLASLLEKPQLAWARQRAPPQTPSLLLAFALAGNACQRHPLATSPPPLAPINHWSSRPFLAEVASERIRGVKQEAKGDRVADAPPEPWLPSLSPRRAHVVLSTTQKGEISPWQRSWGGVCERRGLAFTHNFGAGDLLSSFLLLHHFFLPPSCKEIGADHCFLGAVELFLLAL